MFIVAVISAVSAGLSVDEEGAREEDKSESGLHVFLLGLEFCLLDRCRV